MVNRDGSCRVRPGLRYLNFFSAPDPDNDILGTAENSVTMVGSHEPFYLNDGSKAYLYAVREDDGTVGFRVLAQTPAGQIVQTLDDIGFEIPQTEATINFTAATTYVKYLQIDNKIFALSNAGETMRLFYVGTQKLVKRLYSIERPDWTVEDKLEVVHPDASWINAGEPTGTRLNRAKNPTFEKDLESWEVANDYTNIQRSDTLPKSGTYSMRLNSIPQRTNVARSPLHDVSSTGITGWTEGTDVTLSAQGDSLRIRVLAGASDDEGIALSEKLDVEGGQTYKVAFDLDAQSNMSKIGLMVRYFNSSGNQIGNDDVITRSLGTGTNRKVSPQITTPGGCVKMRVCPLGKRQSGNGITTFDISNVYVGLTSDPGGTAAFSGASGSDYYWTGTVNDSASVYHPPQDVAVRGQIAAQDDDYAVSAYLRAGSTSRNAKIDLRPETTTGAIISTDTGSTSSVTSAAWVRISNTTNTPSNTAALRYTIVVQAVARGEYFYVDEVLIERDNTVNGYFDGSTADTSTLRYDWTDEAHASTSTEYTYVAVAERPAPETKTANTLISSTASDNDYSFGFFYTFSNEIGESAASQVRVVRAQRPWTGWIWESPNGSGEPSGSGTPDPLLCADQLVALLPIGMLDLAKSLGALKWSLYMYTWSNQDPTPVSAMKVAEKELTDASTEDLDSWLRVTPQAEILSDQALVPAKSTRFNATAPSSGGQGIVAADRMVMVFDPLDQARIKWSSNEQGSYSDFSPSKGGGYKTLTSGNLMIPACVKLWQNPQSVDTLTILCLGTDGMSTGYYMAPAQVASQSETVNIMAFEETTATPGTTSPYGCEVLNNSLYHPLDEHLMKSNAANYNINHTIVTDQIQDVWRALANKQRIVSSQLDNRLYFLVHNLDGAVLEEGCWGNEVWVFDAAQKQGSWSRWTVQGQSLRKIEQGGMVYMSLVHPSGIYYFDDGASTDDYVDDAGDVQTRNIPWLLETNTQGANRAHDAWSNLQQANIQVGFFTGEMEYGIRGKDVNGKDIEIRKVIRDNAAPGSEAYDIEDFLLIRKVMKEWFFFAHSTVDDNDVVQPSSGQISLVQYRYTPSTVNTGYEYGSVETFEYGTQGDTVFNGVPRPMIDEGRP